MIERPDRGPVGALYDVGVDLELRLAVGVRIGRQQQIVVGLLGVGLLRAGPHDDPPREHATGTLVEHAVEILVALAVVGRVIDRRMVIGVLLAGEQVQPIENQRPARTRQHRTDVVTRQRSAERDEMEVEGTVASLV